MPRVVRAVFMLAFAVFLSGCGKSDVEFQGQTEEGLPPEAIAVRKAFAEAPASFRNPVEQAIKLVKAGSVNRTAYAEALPSLQKLASNTSISAEQKQALEALVQWVRGELSNRRPGQ